MWTLCGQLLKQFLCKQYKYMCALKTFNPVLNVVSMQNQTKITCLCLMQLWTFSCRIDFIFQNNAVDQNNLFSLMFYPTDSLKILVQMGGIFLYSGQNFSLRTNMSQSYVWYHSELTFLTVGQNHRNFFPQFMQQDLK